MKNILHIKRYLLVFVCSITFLCPQLSKSQNWDEIIKATAADGTAGDEFGYSVAISGNTAIVGAYGDDDAGSNSGAAYVFVLTGNTWAQEAKLTAADGAADDYFGWSVAISGNTAIVGADLDDDAGNTSGSAYVFVRTGNTWTQEAKLTAADGAAGDFFGRSVAISGNTAIVGAHKDDNSGSASGSAYVFVRSGNTWTQEAKLTATDGADYDLFGVSVAISGNTAIVGAYLNDDAGYDSGAAYVFVRSGTTWNQEDKLIAAEGSTYDHFGWSVAISGNTAIVGAYRDDDTGGNRGAAYVFARTGTTWNQEAKLTAADRAAGDYFGWSVAISGNTAIVGAVYADVKAPFSGAAYVFGRTGTTWNQEDKLTPTDGANQDYFGNSVTISGDYAIAGAPFNDDAGYDSGSAYFFKPETPLTITCPDAISVNTTVGQCGAIVNFEATATGTPVPTITYLPASGSMFPIGETTVTATATNDAESIECTFTVNVTLNNHIWTGNINTDWTNASNWQCNNAPGLATNSDILIPSGMPNYPVLVVGQDLLLEEDASLTVETDASLTFNPNVILNTKTVMTNDGTVTFKSDATGTAIIASQHNAAKFIGEYTIERYIPAKRAFRFLSTPVTTSAPIADNWQQATHITGSSSGANGFDATNSGNPSMYTFNNLYPSWDPIPNTDNTILTAGTPYRLFVRGDRTTDLFDNDATPSPTTLVSKGELTAENTGYYHTYLNELNGGFSFVGNPYQAQVNMNSVIAYELDLNVNSNFYWVWDPTINTRGGYVTVILATGNNSSQGASEANQYLQVGQGCFVQSRIYHPRGNYIVFRPSFKHTSTQETNVFKSSAKTASTGQLGLNLYESSAFTTENGTVADGVLILFDDNGNNDVDFSDATKFTNLDENLATNIDGNFLSVDSRATPSTSDEIQLEINTYRHTDYVLVAKATALQGDTPFLVDTYLNQTTELLQNGETPYAYSIDAGIPASFAGDRFKIIFQKTLAVANTELSKVLLYPNPTTTGNFFLNIPNGINDLELTIFNALGAKVFETNGLATGNRIPVNANFIKNSGVYFVNLTSKGLTTTKKLIIN
ncbi:T9SS type A sorting domain-containing protein [Algibacter amylolyticus]|uniref:T9SS type A sorting domain-containing protein n=1 Tax=Algibacter amylolyticus TaxID=1608400 RepID=A0A5M7BGI2_9FLAO|nr:T9SS type A sorting domain-containing protein [Algibacter amylolyticus]KAA5827598.1 T9SS type A sorting domain-containing protein [Algibacter amylolyticus]MBB5266806.1 hypothetical protein [Algibacter amylolyticus]TSJ81843.1 T9SS type A sorting domain-containing protein [Algibacter amylolyticus]